MGPTALVDYLQRLGCSSQSRGDCPAYRGLRYDSASGGGRRHEYLTLQEEKEFLAPFFAQAHNGEIATVAQIQRAFEAKIGHEVDDSTIYRLLARHGWRKLMPRPRHPQADLQAQEQFKKTLKRKLKRQSQREQSKMNVRF